MNFKDIVLKYLKINESAKVPRKPRDIPEITLVVNGKKRKIKDSDEPDFLPSGKNRLTHLEKDTAKERDIGVKNDKEDVEAEKFAVAKKNKKVKRSSYTDDELRYKEAWKKDDEGKALRELKKELKNRKLSYIIL